MTQPNHGAKARAEPVQAVNEVPAAKASGYKIAIRRNGPVVDITLTAGDDYSGMELYDSLVQSAKNGCLRLEISLPNP